MSELVFTPPTCRRPVPARGGGLGEVQRGHERLLHGPLCRRGVELHYQSAATQPHSPDQQRPCQPHPKRLPTGQVGSKICCPVVCNPSKCKIDERIMLI